MRRWIGGTTSCCCCGSFGKKCAVPQRPMIEAMRMRIQQSSRAFKSRKKTQKGGCATKSSLSANYDSHNCQHPRLLVPPLVDPLPPLSRHFLPFILCAFVQFLSDVARLTTHVPTHAPSRAPPPRHRSPPPSPYYLLLCCRFCKLDAQQPFQ